MKISKRETTHLNAVRNIAAQGMVLLQNRDCLPLLGKPGRVILFGSGARQTVKGGTGSGDVNVRFQVSVEQGLENAGFEVITKSWLDDYDRLVASAQKEHFLKIKEIAKDEQPLKTLFYILENPFRKPIARIPPNEDMKSYRADIAIYVLGRISGEGADRLVRGGDYLIDEQEIHDITLLATTYEKCIVLLNVGGVIDVKPLRKIPGIGAILMMGQAGSAGGDAVVDVLLGKVTPSGKLTATWAENYTDYPFSDEFSYMDGNLDDSFYKEGIYVGYRYFDTFNITPSFPFGYGKSYTDFLIEILETTVKGENVILTSKVTNIGKLYSGKEVVQVYSSSPQGKLEKPYQELVAFKKTRELAPGESETLEIQFLIRSMASYCEEQAAYILESGEYFLRVGNSSRNTHIVAALTFSKEVVTEQCKNLFGKAEFQELSRKGYNSYTYQGELEEMENALRIPIDTSKLETKRNRYQEKKKTLKQTEKLNRITMQDVLSEKASLESLIKQLDVTELAELCVGSARLSFEEYLINESKPDSDKNKISLYSFTKAVNTVPGAAGESTSALISDRDIQNLVMADGPAGLRLAPTYYEKNGKNMILPPQIITQVFSIAAPDETNLIDAITHHQYCTAIPIATLLAQTWDEKIIQEVGDLIGIEMDEMGVSLWLAPGMNIQRNPLCGRNFEYFSEDPLVIGLCAAAMTKGVQKHPGSGTTIKHLVANNQESNRLHNNSHVKERALREIYLKGFEICIKKSDPKSIMSSYNLLNGVHTANSYDLLTAAVRDEWGFQGMIMTDWGVTGNKEVSLILGIEYEYGFADPAGCIQAGNDLIMPGSQEDVDRIIETLNNPSSNQEYSITIGDLQWCALNILRVISKSSRYKKRR
jgi:beta-glucosidase-like glycosyl hydrolase